MKKKDEIANPSSCFNRAASEEGIFVLREGDPAFKATIAYWCVFRVMIGKNSITDDKIAEAMRIASFAAPTPE